MISASDNNTENMLPLHAVVAKKIGYFSHRFPDYSESKVYREFLKMEELEFDVRAIAISLPGIAPMPNEALGLLNRTIILDEFGKFSRFFFHTARFFRSPVRYISTLFKHILDVSIFTRSIFKAISIFSDGVVLANVLEKEKIEHLHVHFIDKPGSIALAAHRLTQIPYSVSSHHRDIFEENLDLNAKVENAGWVRTISKYGRDYLLKSCPSLEREKLKVLPISVDMNIFTGERSEKNALQKPRILTIMPLTDENNLDLIIQASKLLDSRDVEFETIIVGEGPEKAKLQKKINQMRLNQRVRLSGLLRMEEVRLILKTADIFFLPRNQSYLEQNSFPTALIEAMASGLPVITTEAKGILELIDENDGRILPANDPRQVADVIQNLLEDTELREKLGENARARVVDQYDIDRNIGELIHMFFPEVQVDGPLKAQSRFLLGCMN